MRGKQGRSHVVSKHSTRTKQCGRAWRAAVAHHDAQNAVIFYVEPRPCSNCTTARCRRQACHGFGDLLRDRSRKEAQGKQLLPATPAEKRVYILEVAAQHAILVDVRDKAAREAAAAMRAILAAFALARPPSLAR